MLCAREEDNLLCFVPLKKIEKVSPVNNRHFVCRIDDNTGAIFAKALLDNTIYNTGPVRGSPDPDVDLKAILNNMGATWSTLGSVADLVVVETTVEEDVTIARAVTSAEEEAQTRDPTDLEVSGDDFLSVCELDGDFDLDDAFELSETILDDVESDSA